MKQRNRNYISHSFSLTEYQLQDLDRYCKVLSKKLNARVTMSEMIRALLDNFLDQIDIGPATDAEPMPKKSNSK